MTTRPPWSVKGIDPKAREIAKDRARRSGLTLGEWLSEMISGGHHETAPPPELEPEEDALEPIVAALQALSERIDTSERVQAEQAARLEAALAEVRAEQAEAAWRLKAAEQDGGHSRIDALRSLEGALNRVAARLQTGEGRADEAVAALHERMDAAAGRIADLEQQLRQAATAPAEAPAAGPAFSTVAQEQQAEVELWGEDPAGLEPQALPSTYDWAPAPEQPDVFKMRLPEPESPPEAVDLVDRTRQSETRAEALREEARTADKRHPLPERHEPEPPVFEIPKSEILPAPPVPPAEEHAPLVFAPAPRRPARKPAKSNGGVVLAIALVLLLLLIGGGYMVVAHPEALGLAGAPAPAPAPKPPVAAAPAPPPSAPPAPALAAPAPAPTPAAPKPVAVAPAAAAKLARPPPDLAEPARTEPKPAPPT